MTLYEIEDAIERWEPRIESSTGEVLNYEELDELNMARETKIENVALYIKNLTAEAAAIKTEENALADRRKTAEKKAERLRSFLDMELHGVKFSTPRVKISFRSSKAVELDDSFMEWAKKNASELLRSKDPEPDKTLIREKLENGVKLPYARLKERTSIQIK